MRYSRRRRSGRRKRPTTRRYRKANRKTRRTTRRPRMSRRSILNTTSTKKRNTMLQWSNTNPANGVSQTVALSPFVINGSTGTSIALFNCTAQDLTQKSGGPNTVANMAERTSTTCFIKGFSEKWRIQTSSPIPWFWRRIVFRARNTQFTTFNGGDTPTQTNSGSTSYLDTSSGMQRLYLNLAVNASNQTINQINEIVFKGSQGTDWNDAQTALLDTARIDVVRDIRTTIKSTNAAGAVRESSHYFAYNHNLVYADDENGEQENSSYLSVQDKKGGGDMYILDFFTPGIGASASDLLAMISTSTLYWHEK